MHYLFLFSDGNSFEYYVLDTDYDSYALGYGCVNLENNQRRGNVYYLPVAKSEWKLVQLNCNKITDNWFLLNIF